MRPQSVADMEELGRNLENMQIVNSRFQRDDEDTVHFYKDNMQIQGLMMRMVKMLKYV